MTIFDVFRKKTAPKPEIKPDYAELLLDLAQRVETLERHIAKLHLKQSPGRPPQTPQTDTQVINIGGREYKVGPTIRK